MIFTSLNLISKITSREIRRFSYKTLLKIGVVGIKEEPRTTRNKENWMCEIMLSPGAYRAVMSSVLTGPNCTTRGSLTSYRVPRKETSLSSLSKYLDEGPDTFLTVYVATNRKFKSGKSGTIRLESIDVAEAYCLDHIAMVRVGELIFKDEGGASASYFSMLRERGFVLNEIDLPAYLYSCIGKPGEIISIDGNTATIKTDHCVILGAMVPKEAMVGDWVVLHFATAISILSEKEAKEIQNKQRQNAWFKALLIGCPDRIDYKDFCGNDLSDYARKRLDALR